MTYIPILEFMSKSIKNQLVLYDLKVHIINYVTTKTPNYKKKILFRIKTSKYQKIITCSYCFIRKALLVDYT